MSLTREAEDRARQNVAPHVPALAKFLALFNLAEKHTCDTPPAPSSCPPASLPLLASRMHFKHAANSMLQQSMHSTTAVLSFLNCGAQM